MGKLCDHKYLRILLQQFPLFGNTENHGLNCLEHMWIELH